LYSESKAPLKTPCPTREVNGGTSKNTRILALRVRRLNNEKNYKELAESTENKSTIVVLTADMHDSCCICTRRYML